ncbi:hypothetical protein [Geopseudomonas aromaticivorans]
MPFTPCSASKQRDGTLEVTVHPEVMTGSSLAAIWFFEAVEAQYRAMGAPMRFDRPTQDWRSAHQRAALVVELQLTAGQRLLSDAVLALVRSPASSLDQSWLVLSQLATMLASESLEAEEGVRLQYSVRHGQGKAFRLLTLRTPLAERFGQEAADNLTAALVAALRREEGKDVRIAGAGAAAPRRAPSNDLPFGLYLVYRAFRDHLLRLSSEQCRQLAGEVVAITHAFERLGDAARG